jgi:hypothetical protein
MTLIEELEDELVHHRDRVLVIASAGVSIASTECNPVASWRGLLREGVEYCAARCAGLPTGWRTRMLAQLEQGDLVEMLSVAEDISTRLGFPTGGDYAGWLKATVGSLRATSPRLIQSLGAWNVQIATTNYDELIEEVTGRKAITWSERALANQFLRGDIKDILHVHGFWRNPQSVILGIRSYEEILRDDFMQALLQGFLMNRTLIFVGCGAGLEDPNFGALLRWCQRVLACSVHNHFRLACRTEIEQFAAQHPPGSRIKIVDYGAEHQDLVTFLEGITSRVRQRSVPQDPTQQLLLAQADVEMRRADLNSRCAELGATDYLLGVLGIAWELWQTGGRTSAWMILAGAFDRQASGLSPTDRLRIGIELAQMMVEDQMSERATPVLQRLTRDAGDSTVPSSLTALFWQLQVRCFTDLCAYAEAVQAIRHALTATSDENSRARLLAELAEIQLLQGDEDQTADAEEKKA